MLELRLPRDQIVLRGNEKISPKIASLQERISQFSLQQDGGNNGGLKNMELTLTKDRFGYPVNGASPVTDAQAKPNQTNPEPSNVLKGQVQSKKELFMKQLSSPDHVGDMPPPPPPPRSTGPRQFNSHTLGRKPAPSYQFGNSMIRSNSQVGSKLSSSLNLSISKSFFISKR